MLGASEKMSLKNFPSLKSPRAAFLMREKWREKDAKKHEKSGFELWENKIFLDVHVTDFSEQATNIIRKAPGKKFPTSNRQVRPKSDLSPSPSPDISPDFMHKKSGL